MVSLFAALRGANGVSDGLGVPGCVSGRGVEGSVKRAGVRGAGRAGVPGARPAEVKYSKGTEIPDEVHVFFNSSWGF